jgi:hypothetical protein
MEKDAMFFAVEAFRPTSLKKRNLSPLLPPGMLIVIKAAAGDDATLAQQADIHRKNVEQVKDAAKHYLLRLLLEPNNQGLRLLGLSDGATESQIKDHKRWLLKWLHPDRNPNSWEQSLFHKVSSVKIEASSSVNTLAGFADPPSGPLTGNKSGKTSGPTTGPLSGGPPRPTAQVARKKSLQSKWNPKELRRRDASTRRIVLRIASPLIATGSIAGLFIFLFSIRDRLGTDPIKLLTNLVGN